MSFELAAPTQLSSCSGEIWEEANTHKELQIAGISGDFDQKLVILFFGEVVHVLMYAGLYEQELIISNK